MVFLQETSIHEKSLTSTDPHRRNRRPRSAHPPPTSHLPLTTHPNNLPRTRLLPPRSPRTRLQVPHQPPQASPPTLQPHSHPTPSLIINQPDDLAQAIHLAHPNHPNHTHNNSPLHNPLLPNPRPRPLNLHHPSPNRQYNNPLRLGRKLQHPPPQFRARSYRRSTPPHQILSLLPLHRTTTPHLLLLHRIRHILPQVPNTRKNNPQPNNILPPRLLPLQMGRRTDPCPRAQRHTYAAPHRSPAYRTAVWGYRRRGMECE